MYSLTWVGLGLALFGTLLGIALARRPEGRTGYYERSVYHLTPIAHRRFAAISAVVAVAFAVAAAVPAFPATWLLALYAFAFIFYAASFARGFSGEDE
ncbi:MAG: hypothetical protein JO101_11760 [Candidatus Eremiobacteraeota bacterium]|nr:hypothetical protein [Candidatus Eremiobacteraeota bacterium]